MNTIYYVHDYPIGEREGKLQWSVGLPETYFDRFRRYTAEVALVSRIRPVGQEDSYTAGRDGFVRKSAYSQCSYPLVLWSLWKNRAKLRDECFVINFPTVIGFFILLFLRPRFYVLEHVNDSNLFRAKRFGLLVTWLIVAFQDRFFRSSRGVINVASYLTRDSYPPISATASNVDVQSVGSVRNPTPGPIKIGSVGAVSLKKGSDLLVEAAKFIDRDFELHFFGEVLDQNIVDSVPNNLKSKIFFHGMLRKEVVLERLGELDLYVQASRAEGLPRATIEAMSVGLPCIGNDHPSARELIDSRFIISLGRNDALARKVEALSDIGVYRALSEHSICTASRYLEPKVLEIRTNFYSAVFGGCYD
ncbi:glycosyltransferase family 4 protein [Limimaricola pyoseonensis]|uniref:Glycosyltransferase involved in cell wall bisynthesis n=1 Tax=Limimaricola pyoseonensis TaxID=521013 RepID=A0A1G7KLK6_9RHOB|nr:glycosyltransferase family 4 protein [Limimaricola pyoseonensis]SDF37810.1 Glycosyltransferase involved in cell wall bisynthesis [Limimaricola pyoseonensis]